jgi:transposase
LRLFRRRHEYVTVVNDLEGRVLHVGDDRKQETLDAFFEDLGEAGCRKLESVAMDMWGPYIASTRKYVPEAASR